MKVPDPETMRADYLAHLQPHVAEPILAIGFLSPAGMMGTYAKEHAAGNALRLVSPLAAWAFRGRKATQHVESPTVTQLVAVGMTTVSLFPYPTGVPFAINAAPTVWLRSDVRATADQPGRASQGIHVDLRNGEHHDFEIAKSGKQWGGWSDAMRDLLCQPVSA